MKGWLFPALLVLALLLSVGCEVWIRPPSGPVVVTPPPSRHDQGSHDEGSHDDDSSERKRRSRSR